MGASWGEAREAGVWGRMALRGSRDRRPGFPQGDWSFLGSPRRQDRGGSQGMTQMVTHPDNPPRPRGPGSALISFPLRPTFCRRVRAIEGILGNRQAPARGSDGLQCGGMGWE